MTILKADDTAATRLLTAAVRRARVQIRGYGEVTLKRDGDVVHRWRPDDRAAVVAMLAEATRSAALLIDGES